MSATRIAIHAHIFYPVLWPELAKCIHSFDQFHADLFLTYPETLPDSFSETLLHDFPNASVRRLENRGYDIGPFVDTISRIGLDDYDIVVKLHTKRNRRAIVKFMPYWGGMWRRKLLAFCATPHAVKHTLSVFDLYPEVGAVGHGDLIMHSSDELTPGAASTPVDQDFSFVAGTMFAIRAKLLKRITAEISFADFPAMQGRTNSELAWAWERNLGRIVELQHTTFYAYPQSSTLFHVAQCLFKRLYMAYCTIFKR